MSKQSNASKQSGSNFIKTHLFSPSVDKKVLLGHLKRDYSIDEIRKAIKSFETHPVVQKYFFGIPFPKKLDQLGTAFYTHVVDIEKELLVQTIAFKKYEKKLNIIIKEKHEFEKQLIIGNYEKAERILTKIQEEFGFSLWLIENKFILEELTGGLQKNIEFLNFINQNSDNAFVTSLAHYYSLKAERRTSAITYINKVNSFKEGFKKHLQDYISFKLNFFFEYPDIDELEEIISFESIFSLIDRYLAFLRICQTVLLSEKFNVSYYSKLRSSISELIKYIEDPTLNNISIAYEVKEIPQSETEDEEILSLYESYTTGDYNKSIFKCQELLLTNPSEFTLIEIYIKSLLYLNNNFDTEKKIFIGENENTLLNQAIINTFFLLSRGEHSSVAISDILKKIITYQSSSWAVQLYCFMNRNTTDEENSKIERFKYINSTLINPLLFKIFITPTRASAFLADLNRKYHFNVVMLFSIISKLASKNDVLEIAQLEMPVYRKLFYQGKGFQKLGTIEDAAILFENLVNSNPDNINLYEESLIELLKCLLELNKFDDYITIYSKNFIRNSNLVSRADYKNIHAELLAHKFKNTSHSIFLAIFLKITNQGNHKINIAIRSYLKRHNLKNIKDVISLVTPENINVMVYFLMNICTTEILKYFPYFKGTKEILNERIDICQALLTIDPESKDLYDDEISKIVQNLIVLEAIREVDESKIYVDEKGLRTNELKETKNNFLRYVEISDLIKEVPLFFIDLINNKKILINIPVGKYTEEEVEKSKIAEDIKFELFKELFFEIRDAFLFNNKYGLDSYLSTRIRHGTLLGQIRSQFQDQFLISQKDKESEEYYDNEYWKNKLSYLTEDQATDIQEYLAEFSLKIDTLTNKLKNTLLQIRTNSKNNSGLFDYTFPTSSLNYYYKLQFQNIIDYNEFLDESFKHLWDQTSLNLEIIRQHISTAVKEEYIQCLDELDNNLKKLKVDSKEFQELLTNVINCKTNISYELDKIADWFQIKETKISDFVIAKAIDTSLEITNKVSKETKLIAKNKSITSDTIIRGEYFIDFFDLLMIFLNNIVKYSDLTTDQLLLEIYAQESNGILKITIKNNLNASIDIDLLKLKFEQKSIELDKPNWDMDKIKKEEGTGFFKAKKILLTDLQCDSNNYSFSVDDKNLVEIAINIHLQNIRL